MAGATSKQSPPVDVTAGPSKAASSKGSLPPPLPKGPLPKHLTKATLPPPPPARWPAQPRSSGRGHRHNPCQERREAAQSVVATERLRVETFGHQQGLLGQSSQHSLQLQAQQHKQKKNTHFWWCPSLPVQPGGDGSASSEDAGS